jgi:hypothetical protein
LNVSKVLTTGSALTFDGTNLGLGVTPSAWGSSFKSIELGAKGVGIASNPSVYNTILSSNAYQNGTGWTYGNSSYASQYQIGNSGTHSWYIAPSGTAGNAITFTQAMTLDASGNLGLGTTSPNIQTWRSGTVLTVSGNVAGQLQLDSSRTDASTVALGSLQFTYSTNSTNYKTVALIESYSTGSTANQRGGALQFSTSPGGTTSPSVNMILDGSGNLLVGTTSALGTGLSVVSGSNTFYGKCTNSGQSVGVFWNSGNNAGTASSFLNFGVGTSSYSVAGTVTYNGSIVLYNTTSDRRLKENIVDAETALTTIGQIKVRAFDWINSKTHETHGIIAQELKEIAPHCVTEGTDHENGSIENPWQVDTSPLVPMLVKAIQELSAQVTTLQAQVTALQGAK